MECGLAWCAQLAPNRFHNVDIIFHYKLIVFFLYSIEYITYYERQNKYLTEGVQKDFIKKGVTGR
jgi:hypothetical protein